MSKPTKYIIYCQYFQGIFELYLLLSQDPNKTNIVLYVHMKREIFSFLLGIIFSRVDSVLYPITICPEHDPAVILFSHSL